MSLPLGSVNGLVRAGGAPPSHLFSSVMGSLDEYKIFGFFQQQEVLLTWRQSYRKSF
jgi:hypothetical protein